MNNAMLSTNSFLKLARNKPHFRLFTSSTLNGNENKSIKTNDNVDASALDQIRLPNGKLDSTRLPIIPSTPLDARKADFSEEEYAATLVHGRGIHTSFFHPRTHDIPVANIHFRSHHPRYLELFTHFATHAAYSLGIPISKPYYLPTKRTLWTVLRGPFAHKKSQENFERRVHKRGIKAWDADPEVVDKWVQYLRTHAMGGVGMRVTKWERLPLGVGESRLADVLIETKELDKLASDKIKALGDKIIQQELAGIDTPSDIVSKS